MTAHAGPWAEPGDVALRDDLQRLNDAGVIDLALTTWPLSYGDIKRGIDGVKPDQIRDPALQAALGRIRARVRRATRSGQGDAHISLAANPVQLRGFESAPREDAEVGAALEWTGDRFAGRLEAALVNDPDDGRDVRFDGSYAGVAFGNWMLSLSRLERWWGPGWDGSLILSNNARPVPTVALERNRTTAFSSPWLSWIGPWKFIAFIGQLEEARDDAPDAKFLGARLTVKPLPGLEIGISRTAQWGGEGRPENFDTLTDVLFGDTNQGNSQDSGNQLGGFDARWALPPGWGRLAVYGQFIGEDEAGGLPSQYLSQGGIELWGSAGWLDGNYRVYFEYADTQAGDRFGTAYNNFIYTDGYRYYGRSLGHSADGDSEIYTLGAVLSQTNGWLWNLRLRNGRLNRGDNPNNTAFPAADLSEVFLSGRASWPVGQLGWGAGYVRVEPDQAGETDEDLQTYVDWSVRF